MNLSGTIWALIPPFVTIVIGLITKKVNLSLIIGILLGALLYCSFNPVETVITSFNVLTEKVSDNLQVIFFVILLGMFVYLLNLSGASKACGNWARKKIKTKKQGLLITFLLGIIIFVDDYFNCLTVGTVMKPVTDKCKISREKLAYIIDTTAAPICMIAPISSWAAAVSSSLPEGCEINGFSLFLKSIGANYYSLFSLLMVLCVILFSVNIGKMKKYESLKEAEVEEINQSISDETSKGKIIDLILPVIFLILACIISMLYTGGLFEGKGLIDSFANCDSIMGLCIGTFISCIFLLVLYVPRKIVTFKEYGDGLIKGFINMVPSILILCFAWTLGGICGANYLNAGGFISSFVSKYNISISIMPMMFFLVSLLLSFSTGTSWGTFAILIPMVVAVFNNVESEMLVITIAAVLGGSVCGDHLSPISDTTILSATGAGCEMINHVNSQLPYGIIVAIISFLSYLVSGLTGYNWIGLIFGFATVLLFIGLFKTYEHYKINKKE